MAPQHQLCIRIEARSAGAMPESNTLNIIVIPTAPTIISFEEEGAKLDANTVGLALGVLWGAVLVFLGLVASLTGYGTGMVERIAFLHIGYDTTMLGILMGGVFGLVYGFILCAVLVRVYNVVFARGADS